MNLLEHTGNIQNTLVLQLRTSIFAIGIAIVVPSPPHHVIFLYLIKHFALSQVCMVCLWCFLSFGVIRSTTNSQGLSSVLLLAFGGTGCEHDVKRTEDLRLVAQSMVSIPFGAPSVKLVRHQAKRRLSKQIQMVHLQSGCRLTSLWFLRSKPVRKE